MNGWGIPDWLDAASYGAPTKWTRNRWRWEFVRRRDDVRAAFDEQAESCYRHVSQFAGKEGFATAHLRPEEPGFTAMHPLALSLGLPRLPNPRISDQPCPVIAFRDWEDTVMMHVSEYPPDGFKRIDFDLRKPIEPQLAFAKYVLKEEQALENGKSIQRRRHPAKWLTYLRVLDGRAAGALWADLTVILPFRNGTEKAAQETWEQADALRFNF